jgi:hypothetical protein
MESISENQFGQLISVLTEISASLKVIARNSSAPKQAQGGTAPAKQDVRKHISGERYPVKITDFGAMWKNKPGMFYKGYAIVDGIEYPCSIGVADKLGVRLAKGQTVFVSGMAEKKLYKGEEFVSIFANSIDFEEEQQPNIDDSDIAIGGNDNNADDIPF